MKIHFSPRHSLWCGMICTTAMAWLMPLVGAQEAPKPAIAVLEKALVSAADGASEARQRLSVRRVIRDAEKQLESLGDKPDRWPMLEFLFRARQRLIALDDDANHRQALIETGRELVKAPDEFAELRLEADLLLSQAELAKQGANAEARAEALRPFVARYVDTPAGAKVLRMAMVMALELGDSRLVTDLREIIEQRFAADLEMIAFQRDKLGGQVFGAPFVGTFERTDGKMLRFPMDGLGRTTMFVFWSQDNGGDEVMKNVAAAALAKKKQLAGRIEIISVNLDELPDAGEAVVRAAGVDWQVLRLPGGRQNPIFKTYVRTDPRRVTVSPTGQAAMTMTGSTRKKTNSDGTPDYARMFQSTLARSWTKPRYSAQLSSLMTGDFLVFDPEGGIDPSRPPELKAFFKGDVPQPLARNAASVPEETLRAIQECFVAQPMRYRLDYATARAHYEKAVEICRKTIANHPEAPDLWIVRNRLMVALLGLWKADADLAQLEAAIAEAKTAIEAGYPSGCDVVARFCIAREALRDPAADSGKVIDQFVADNGGESASGPVLAVAALLAFDVADRKRFEDYRGIILNDHTEAPMMWTFTAFLLDRYHSYWNFQVPFTAGWSYGRREAYFQTKGTPEKAERFLKTELQTLEGEPLNIPADLDSQLTAIVFAKPGPWSRAQRLAKTLADLAASRPGDDLKVYIAMLAGDAETIRAGFSDSEALCPILTVPGGVENPLVHRLGILAEGNQINSVLLGSDGRIVAMVSGLAMQHSRSGTTLINVIESVDEKFVSDALARGDIESAKERILSLAPPYDPEAVDAKGRKLRKPKHSLAHLRARTRVYMALDEWDKALADAEEVAQRQLGIDGGMSLRTDALDDAENLRDVILQKQEEAKK